MGLRNFVDLAAMLNMNYRITVALQYNTKLKLANISPVGEFYSLYYENTKLQPRDQNTTLIIQ